MCINQDSAEEKDHQVAMMGTIYAAAMLVVIWLGPSKECSDVLMVIFSAGRVKNRHWFSYRISLESFLRRDWFRRVWVVQELTVAREDPRVCCGHSVTWSRFADALGSIMLVVRTRPSELGAQFEIYMMSDTVVAEGVRAGTIAIQSTCGVLLTSALCV
jgi:hypothetical protein